LRRGVRGYWSILPQFLLCSRFFGHFSAMYGQGG
jgi:hypothetical protein